MTRHIIVAITPDADGVRCGRCDLDTDCVFSPGSLIARVKRSPECLAAERKLAALIEAGERLNERCTDGTSNKAWDRAVAEVK